MNLQKLYLTKVLPHLSKFKMCEIYGFEIKKIEQQLAESFNKKNIHEALDIPDFKHVKNKKILPEIIKTAIKKLKIVDEFENEKNGFLKINNTQYKLVTFSSEAILSVYPKALNCFGFSY